MGADSVTVVYGLRYRVAIDDEHLDDAVLEPYELETDPRMVRAREAGLESWWGRDCDGGEWYLLIGRVVARLGAEHDLHVELTDAAWAGCRDDVRQRLAAAGFQGEASLHFQAHLHEPDDQALGRDFRSRTRRPAESSPSADGHRCNVLERQRQRPLLGFLLTGATTAARPG